MTKFSRPVWLPLLSWALLLAILLLTDPLRLPLIALLIPFILLFIAVKATIRLILSKLYKPGSAIKISIVSTGLAVILVFVLVLQSLGQLSWRDILLTAGLIAATVFYFYKSDVI